MAFDSETPLHVAIVGAGPAGFYAAEALLKQKDIAVRIDFFDRMPAPYGLVRYGVAPDHQKIKSVTRIYDRVGGDERVRFFGNVEFGSTVRLSDLLHSYDQVVYAVGARSDRSLNIPGEDLDGSMSATEFVAWYNGHPDYESLDVPLDHEAVAVIGVGNVAVDVARILAKSTDELRTSDIADHALDALEKSSVTDIYIFGRRGPAQAKFTNPEIREFGELEVADPIVEPALLELDPASAAAIEGNRVATKNIAILKKFAEGTSTKRRRVHFLFQRSPVEILGEDGKVREIRVCKNALDAQEDGYINAVATDEFETYPVGMVLRSVGYRGTPLADVPFDERRARSRTWTVASSMATKRRSSASTWWGGPSAVRPASSAPTSPTPSRTVRTMLGDLDEITPTERPDIATLLADRASTPSASRSGRRSTPTRSAKGRGPAGLG